MLNSLWLNALSVLSSRVVSVGPGLPADWQLVSLCLSEPLLCSEVALREAKVDLWPLSVWSARWDVLTVWGVASSHLTRFSLWRLGWPSPAGLTCQLQGIKPSTFTCKFQSGIQRTSVCEIIIILFIQHLSLQGYTVLHKNVKKKDKCC